MIYPKNRNNSRTRVWDDDRVSLHPVRRNSQLRRMPWPPVVVLDPYFDDNGDELAVIEAVRSGRVFDGTLIMSPTPFNDREVIPHLPVYKHLSRAPRRTGQQIQQEAWEYEERERQRAREETADWVPVPVPDPVPQRKREWTTPVVEEFHFKFQSEILALIGPCPWLILEGE